MKKSTKKTSTPAVDPLSGRGSGVLLHPSSLSGRFGIGDLGPESDKFLEFLADAQQRYWMMLPTSPTARGDYHCPYSSYSGFAGNPLLISPEKLAEAGFCSTSALTTLATRSRSANPRRVDLRKVEIIKGQFLREVFEQNRGKARVRQGLESFRTEHSWADDFALFASLRKSIGLPRSQWPRELRVKDGRKLPQLIKTHEDEISFQLFCQWLFFEQFKELKCRATEKGIFLLGDLPIYVSDDSADVWASPRYFLLDDDKRPKLLSGCPPDDFAKTGQLWGHPIYDWAALKKDGFSWWVARMRTILQLSDIVRIDHFRGLAAYYAVPYGSKTAEHGSWYTCPGADLLGAFRSAFGSVPVVAEDLGFITDDVHELRDAFGLLGMRVLQFGFGKEGYATNIHAPFNVTPHSVIFTGTHDNDTARAWIASVPAEERKRIFALLGNPRAVDFAPAFVRMAMATPAQIAITPLQDLLGLGSSARMNRPGTTRWDNWSWRHSGSLKLVAKLLGDLTVMTGRAG